MLCRIIILIGVCNIAHGDWPSLYDVKIHPNGFSNDYFEFKNDNWKDSGANELAAQYKWPNYGGYINGYEYVTDIHYLVERASNENYQDILDDIVDGKITQFQTNQGYPAILFKWRDYVAPGDMARPGYIGPAIASGPAYQVEIDGTSSTMPREPEEWLRIRVLLQPFYREITEADAISMANSIFIKNGTPSPRKNLPGFAEIASSDSGGNGSSTGNVEDTAGSSTNTEDGKTNSGSNSNEEDFPTTEPNNTNNALSNNLKPLAGSSGWYELDWFGYFFDSQNVVSSMGGWVFHEDLGWLFLEFSSGDRVWCWASNKGWLWTSSSAYPYLYSDESNNWIYVFSESTTEVNVFNFNPNSWGAWQDLTLMKMTDPGPGSTANNSAKIQQIDGVLNSTQSSEAKISSIAEIIRANL